MRKQLSTEILAKHELEFEVKQLKDKESHLQLQLDAVSTALQKHEEHFASGRNESVQQKQQKLDIMTKTLESVKEQLLKEQVSKFKLANRNKFNSLDFFLAVFNVSTFQLCQYWLHSSCNFYS